jgi:hypothetical protein
MSWASLLLVAPENGIWTEKGGFNFGNKNQIFIIKTQFGKTSMSPWELLPRKNNYSNIQPGRVLGGKAMLQMCLLHW